MADPLKPIERKSLTQTELQKYESGGIFALGAATKAGKGTYAPTNDLASRYSSGTNFGMGAKKAGKPNLAASNVIDTSNKVQNEFRPFAQRGVSSFQPSALNYADGHYKISTVKYKG